MDHNGELLTPPPVRRPRAEPPPPEPNGIIDVDGQAPAQPNGIVNGIQEESDEEPPKMHKMDLERVHVELYNSKYLTPAEFLEDIVKIVHNADVRIQEDPDRLLRAQAMLTAAEVSINDFDPSFRLECQRMAVRERRRREEYRKNKEKEREKRREEREKEKAKAEKDKRKEEEEGKKGWLGGWFGKRKSEDAV